MQFDVSINYWAVLVCGLVSIVVGSVWYGPLFKKPFMEAMGMKPMTPEEEKAMQKQMMPTYLIQFVASLLMFVVLAWLIGALGGTGSMFGVQAAFWVWLGFVMPIQLGRELWGGKMTLFWLGAGNMLVTLLVGGAVLGAWK